MNRLIVRTLEEGGMLRHAYFLWDDVSTASDEGLQAERRGIVSMFNLNKTALTRALINGVFRNPGDLWLCTHVNYAMLVLLANLGRFSRVGVMLHAAELDDTAFNMAKRFAMRCTGHILAVSDYTKAKAVSHGVSASVVHVVPNGIADPCPDWKPANRVRSTCTVLFVGRMDERYKGQKELLGAMEIIRNRLPQVRMVFVGGGRSLEEWRLMTERRGLQNLVEFAGPVSEERLTQAYQEAAIFAMPSENEGFGLVYTEAMAHGLPCIGADRDAAREVILDGETGFCVPAGNATALADAITTLVKLPMLRAAMGQAGRMRFLENFTTERYAARLTRDMNDWRDSIVRNKESP